MSLSMTLEVPQAGQPEAFTVMVRDGVTYITGSVPARTFAALAKGQPRGAVMSSHLAQLARCSFAFGSPDAVDAAVACITADWLASHPQATPLERWCAVGMRGLSSNAIAHKLAGVPCSNPKAHPHDAADLSLCLGLLHQVPELGPKFQAMAEVSLVWASLVRAWPTLEGLCRAELGRAWEPSWKPPRDKRARRAEGTNAAIRAAIAEGERW